MKPVAAAVTLLILALPCLAQEAAPAPAASPPEASPPEASPPEASPPEASPPAARSEDVRYPNGKLSLAAELLLPAGAGPFPGAVLIPGSGSSDRSNAWARSIAEELVGAGVVVLLTDTRGSGESAGDWRSAGFGDLAGDAISGVGFLQRRQEVDPGRVGLVGLSQGGWVAPITASSFPKDVAFVVTISTAAVGFAEQATFEMAATARQAGLGEAEVAQVLTLQRMAARYLSTGDWETYAEGREMALQDAPWAEIARGFPDSKDQPIWAFLRRVYSFDPMPYWLGVTQPSLVVYGAEDEKDNVPVAESVRRLEFVFGLAGKENAEIAVIPSTGHGLQEEGGELVEPFRQRLRSWLEERVTGGGGG